MKPIDYVVNIKTGEAYDVYVGRGSKWGNPFSHKPSSYDVKIVESRSKAIDMYLEYLMSSPILISCLTELRGKRLGCYCKPLQCHAEILAEFANT